MHRTVQYILFQALLALSFFANVSFAANICPLCGSSTEFPKRFDYILSMTPRMTCQDAYFHLARMSIDDSRCSPGQEAWQELCCSDEEPAPLFPTETSGSGPTGNEPTCNICGNSGAYPGNPSGFINARYVGAYSCGTLYNRGLSGLIPGFMCGPLQDYAYTVCGCSYGSYPTQAPVPSPTNPPVSSPTFPPLSNLLAGRKTPRQNSKDALKVSRRAPTLPYRKARGLRIIAGKKALVGEIPEMQNSSPKLVLV